MDWMKTSYSNCYKTYFSKIYFSSTLKFLDMQRKKKNFELLENSCFGEDDENLVSEMRKKSKFFLNA